MHYKNGREARNGDKVMIVDGYNAGAVGFLNNATAGNDYCNGQLVLIHQNHPCPNLKECLHWDDVQVALARQASSSANVERCAEILRKMQKNHVAAYGLNDPDVEACLDALGLNAAR